MMRPLRWSFHLVRNISTVRRARSSHAVRQNPALVNARTQDLNMQHPKTVGGGQFHPEPIRMQPAVMEPSGKTLFDACTCAPCVYATTVYRTAPIDQGGHLISIDWNTKATLGKVPVVPPQPAIKNSNPRGGARGGRGILVDSQFVYAASYHTIHVFTHDLTPLRTFSNPLFVDIHELAWEGNDIWVCSTGLDVAVKVDTKGQTLAVWRPHNDSVTATRFGLQPLSLDRVRDYRHAAMLRRHTHLNTVAMVDERPLILLNRIGCVVRLNPTEILVEDSNLKGAHNLVATEEGDLMINDSRRSRIRIYGIDGEFRSELDLLRFAPVRRIARRFAVRNLRLWLADRSPSFRLSRWIADETMRASQPVFVRGLCLTRRGTVLAGISPATMLEIDWRRGKLVDLYSFSRTVHEAVHGIECIYP